MKAHEGRKRYGRTAGKARGDSVGRVGHSLNPVRHIDAGPAPARLGPEKFQEAMAYTALLPALEHGQPFKKGSKVAQPPAIGHGDRRASEREKNIPGITFILCLFILWRAQRS